MAAQNVGDTAATRLLIEKVIAYTPTPASYNVGLNGHACWILADSIRK
jgi:hypothetical protein